MSILNEKNESFVKILCNILKEAYSKGLKPSYIIIGIHESKIYALEADSKEMVPLFVEDIDEFDYIDDRDVN